MNLVYTHLPHGKVSALLINVGIVLQKEVQGNSGGGSNWSTEIALRHDEIINTILADDAETEFLDERDGHIYAIGIPQIKGPTSPTERLLHASLIWVFTNVSWKLAQTWINYAAIHNDRYAATRLETFSAAEMELQVSPDFTTYVRAQSASCAYTRGT